MHREFSAGVHQRVQLSLIFFLFGKWFACRSASGVFLCAVCLSVSFVRVIYPLVGYLRCILCGGVSRRVVSRLCVDGRCLCLCFLGIVTTFLQAPLVLTGLRVLWVDLAPRARNKHLLSIILGFSSHMCLAMLCVFVCNCKCDRWPKGCLDRALSLTHCRCSTPMHGRLRVRSQPEPILILSSHLRCHLLCSLFCQSTSSSCTSPCVQGRLVPLDRLDRREASDRREKSAVEIH
jgi:hypothetical protein